MLRKCYDSVKLTCICIRCSKCDLIIDLLIHEERLYFLYIIAVVISDWIAIITWKTDFFSNLLIVLRELSIRI